MGIFNSFLAPKLSLPLSDGCISCFVILHAWIMFVAKVVRGRVVNICIVFTFGITISVIYLLLNYFNFMRQKAVSDKNPHSILVFASYCQ